MLSAIASQAAVVIVNTRFFIQTDQALNDHVAELETLNQIDMHLIEIF